MRKLFLHLYHEWEWQRRPVKSSTILSGSSLVGFFFFFFFFLLVCMQTGQPLIVQKQQIVKNPEISAHIKESCLDGNFHVRKEDMSREKRTVILYFILNSSCLASTASS
jgi:hypothetical protein